MPDIIDRCIFGSQAEVTLDGQGHEVKVIDTTIFPLCPF